MPKVPKTKAPTKPAAQTPPTESAHTPYSDLGLGVDATDSQINEAYGSILMRIDVDHDDPHSQGHEELMRVHEMSLARETRRN